MFELTFHRNRSVCMSWNLYRLPSANVPVSEAIVLVVVLYVKVVKSAPAEVTRQNALKKDGKNFPLFFVRSAACASFVRLAPCAAVLLSTKTSW